MNIKSKLSQHRTLALAALLLVFWNTAVWLISDNFYFAKAKILIEQETELAQERADDLGDSIKRNLNYLHGVPDLFSELLRVQWAVTKFGPNTVPSPLATAERAKQWSKDKVLKNLNNYLDFSARSLNVDLIYVVNAAGDAIAASNSNTAGSSLGINVSERPLFQQTKNGLSGMQYAVGKTTKIPGLFFSTPIFIEGKFFGAVVAKADLPSLTFLINQINAFVCDENGVVILARNKMLEMHSLRDSPISTLSRQEKFDLYRTDSFPVLQIEPWPDKRLASLVRIHNGNIPHLLVSKKLPEYNLSVYVDSEIDAIPALRRDYLWFALLVGALGSVLILIAAALSIISRRAGGQRNCCGSRQTLTRSPHCPIVTCCAIA